MRKFLIILGLFLLINPVLAENTNQEIQELKVKIQQLQEQVNKKENKNYLPCSYSTVGGANSGAWLGNKLRNLFKNDEK